MTIKDLSVDHDYYCSDNNYYSNEAELRFGTWPAFFDEFHGADIDMNLIFRWDIKKREESDAYWMELFMIQQRKGIFRPIMINRVFDDDVESIVSFLKPHLNKIKKIWLPLS